MAKKESIAKQITKTLLEEQGIKYNDWIKEKREAVALALLKSTTSTYKDLLDERICEEYADEHLNEFVVKNTTSQSQPNYFNKEEETE